MNRVLIGSCFIILSSSMALAIPIFNITPVSTEVLVLKGQRAFVSYTIENNGFATRIRILPPITPQPMQINETTCPINSGSLAYGASCTVQLMTTYPAEAGILGDVTVYDANGNIGSSSVIPVRIRFTSR